MKIALIGYGKMGKIIERIALERGHEIVSVIDIDNREDFQSEAFRSADVAIEFTQPEAAVDPRRQPAPEPPLLAVPLAATEGALRGAGDAGLQGGAGAPPALKPPGQTVRPAAWRAVPAHAARPPRAPPRDRR